MKAELKEAFRVYDKEAQVNNNNNNKQQQQYQQYQPQSERRIATSRLPH